MGKFTELEIALAIILSIEKAATVERLATLLRPLSRQAIYNTLKDLRKKGIVESGPLWKCKVLGLPIPDHFSSSSRKDRVIHCLSIELEKLWESGEFREGARKYWKANNLDELKRTFLKIYQHVPNEIQSSSF